jgi:PAS domain S-box-containing protein
MNKSKDSLSVLCLEDVLNDVHLINEILIDAGYQVSMDIAKEEKEYLSFLKGKEYDIILSDYTLPGFDIYTALNYAIELQPDVPFICVSGTIGEDIAVELLKLGVADYILKDRLGRLAYAVRRALDEVVKKKEWRNTSEALVKANNELQNLHNNLEEAIFSVDIIQNKMLHVSIAHEAVFGYPQAAFFENPLLWYEIAIPEDKQIINAGYPVLYAGKTLHHEFRVTDSDGQIRWIEAKMSPTLDKEGKLIRIDGIASNITNRKHIEKELQDSNALYQTIFEFTGTATFIFEENLNILMANKECFSITGYLPSELIGQKWTQLFAPESLQVMMKNHYLRRQNPDLAPKKYEVKLVNKQGELRDVILEVGMIPGTKQSIVSILDITDHKQAEEALIKLKKAIDTSGEVVFLTDREGVFTFINPAFTLLYGFTSDEVVGNATPRIVKSGLSIKSVYEVFWKTLLNGDEVKWEIVNKKKDGTLVSIEASSTPVIDEKKNIIGFLGIQRDITDRKDAEQKLIAALGNAEQSETHFRLLIENAPDAIFIQTDFKFSYLNKTALNLYGAESQDQLIGTEIINRIHPDYRKAVIERITNLNVHNLFQPRLEYKHLKLDNTVIEVDVSAAPFRFNDKNGALVFVRDITTRKIVEKELIAALVKAEESDRLKTAFLNNISHEIRTPFNGILGFLNILQDEDVTTEERDEYIRFINQSAERLMQTINDIVEMSQIQTGQMKLKITDTNIKRLTDKLSERFGTAAIKQGLEFKITNELPSEILSFVTDGIKLKTILSNLIVNAIKFTPKGSIEIGIRKSDQTLMFFVKDTGIGISESQQTAIFELFKQADASNTRQFEGLGLGLSITKSYVEMLGGKIWLESEPGKGSTFYFTIPDVSSELK